MCEKNRQAAKSSNPYMPGFYYVFRVCDTLPIYNLRLRYLLWLRPIISNTKASKYRLTKICHLIRLSAGLFSIHFKQVCSPLPLVLFKKALLFEFEVNFYEAKRICQNFLKNLWHDQMCLLIDAIQQGLNFEPTIKSVSRVWAILNCKTRNHNVGVARQILND